MCQATRAEVVLVLESGRSVTLADPSYCDLLDTRDPAYYNQLLPPTRDTREPPCPGQQDCR